MIKFKQDTTLQVIEGYDEATDNITEDVEETFKGGEKVDADIFNDDGTDYVDIQFGDGSVALGVQRDCFEVVK
jgi:hypothetical protein